MKNNVDRKLYIKILQENIGKIIMDKLYDKYNEYINYKILNSFRYENTDKTIYIYDPVYAFFDTLSNKIIDENITYNKTVIYQIISPYNKKDVIYGLLVINNNTVITSLINLYGCKDKNLYTTAYSEHDIKYLSFSDNIFKNSNKIQQE